MVAWKLSIQIIWIIGVSPLSVPRFIPSNNLDVIWLWMAWFQPATVEFWSRPPMFLNSWCSNPIPTRGCLLRLRPKKSGTYRPGLLPQLYLPFCQLSVLLDPHVCWLKPSWSTDRLLDASSFGAINPYLSWVFMMSKPPNVGNPIYNKPTKFGDCLLLLVLPD